MSFSFYIPSLGETFDDRVPVGSFDQPEKAAIAAAKMSYKAEPFESIFLVVVEHVAYGETRDYPFTVNACPTVNFSIRIAP